MHREIRSIERPFQVESNLGLYLFSALIALFVGLEVGPTIAVWLEATLGWRLPRWSEEFSLYGYSISWALAAAILGGTRTLMTSAESLLAGRWGADLAMALAIIAALLLGQPLVAAEVILIGLLGECLEAYTFGRTQRAIRKLVETCPRMCLVQRGGEEVKIRVEELNPGERVVVLPGKRIPVDGLIVDGHTTVDQSNLTGESLPVDKAPGDQVYAGTVNQFGALVVQAERIAEQSVMGQVIQITAAALRNKSTSERTADRWARWFLPIVLGLAAATFLLHYLINRGAPDVLAAAAFPALAVLVVACPCALILATPATMMAALARLVRTGVLIKGGQALERLAETRHLVFDKTGTLTTGQLQVGTVIPLATELSEQDVLRLVAAAEQRSEHPIAQLFQRLARERTWELPELQNFTAHPGGGVAAQAGADDLQVGSRRFLEEQGLAASPAQLHHLEQLDAAGQTALLVARNRELVGLVGLWDTIRPEAAATLAELRRSGLDRYTLLTGDRAAAARAVAERLEIDEVVAEQLPAQKSDYVKRLEREGVYVAMIGDGVNDAPALASAHVGLALGGVGSDIAAEAGDIVLMGDPLRPLPLLFRLAKKTSEILRQNIVWFALGVNLLGIFLTAWLLPLWAPAGRERAPLWAAIYHQIGSLAVLLNAMRLLWFERADTTPGLAQLFSWGRQVDAGLESFNLHDASHWLEERWKPVTAVVGVTAALLYAGTSLVQIPTDAVGVVIRCGRALPETLSPGLHVRWPWPWERVVTVEPERLRFVEIGFRRELGGEWGRQTWASSHGLQVESTPEEALMVTGDGNLLELQLVLEYIVADPVRFLFGSPQPEAVLHALGESVVRELLAQRRFMEVLADERQAFQDAVTARLTERLKEPVYERLGITLQSVAFQDLHPPRQLVESYYEVTRSQARMQQMTTAARRRAEEARSREEVSRLRARALLDARVEETQALAAAQRDGFLALAAAASPQGAGNSLAWELFTFRRAVLAAEQILSGRPKVLRDAAIEGNLQVWPEGLRLRGGESGRERPWPGLNGTDRDNNR